MLFRSQGHQLAYTTNISSNHLNAAMIVNDLTTGVVLESVGFSMPTALNLHTSEVVAEDAPWSYPQAYYNSGASQFTNDITQGASGAVAGNSASVVNDNGESQWSMHAVQINANTFNVNWQSC